MLYVIFYLELDKKTLPTIQPTIIGWSFFSRLKNNRNKYCNHHTPTRTSQTNINCTYKSLRILFLQICVCMYVRVFDHILHSAHLIEIVAVVAIIILLLL